MSLYYIAIEGYNITLLDCNRHGGGILGFTLSHNILYPGSLELKLIIVSICTTVPLTIAFFFFLQASLFHL